MSKSKHILFPSKEEGWELWRIENDSPVLVREFHDDDELALPASTKIAFSSHDVVSWPLILPSNEAQVQKQIAQLSLEQHGLLETDANSWDLYPVSDSSSLFAGVVLSRYNLSHHKTHSNQNFDVAARYYNVGSDDTILCVKEQGKWLSIYYKESNPFYWETLESLGALISQIKILNLEFAQQQILFASSKLLIADKDPVNSVLVSNIEQSCQVPVEQVEKVGLLSNTSSDLHLVPEAVKSDREKKSARNKVLLLTFLALGAYVFLAYFLFDKYNQRKNEIVELEKKVAELEPSWQQSQYDLTNLNELDDVLTNKWPLASFEKVWSHFPANQELRLQVIELQSEFMVIKGVSPNINLINKLFPALKKDPYFEGYKWRMPAPAINPKTKLWQFTMEITRAE